MGEEVDPFDQKLVEKPPIQSSHRQLMSPLHAPLESHMSLLTMAWTAQNPLSTLQLHCYPLPSFQALLQTERFRLPALDRHHQLEMWDSGWPGRYSKHVVRAGCARKCICRRKHMLPRSAFCKG